MSRFSRCLIVFAKEPKKGRVKTRLAEFLNQESAVSIYKAFIQDTLSAARSTNTEKMILAYDSDIQDPKYLKETTNEFELYQQKGSTLGEKMGDALRYAQGLGCKQIVIIGTDSPTLPYLFIDEAFLRLENSDVVLGPTHDGGYYLIGVNGSFDGLFDNIEWSTEYVFTDTIKNANSLNKKVSVLRPWYDVDTPEDISILKDDLKYNNAAEFTKQVLSDIGQI